MCRYCFLIIPKTPVAVFKSTNKKLPACVTGKSENFVSADHWILVKFLAERAARQQPESWILQIQKFSPPSTDYFKMRMKFDPSSVCAIWYENPILHHREILPAFILCIWKESLSYFSILHSFSSQTSVCFCTFARRSIHLKITWILL